MKLFTVGPVEMYQETFEVASRQVPYFRNQEFSDMMLGLEKNLKNLLNMRKEDKTLFLTASGTGGMEATILNCFRKTDRALVISGGTFGKRFEQLCEIYEIPYDVLRVPVGEAFDEAALESLKGKGYTAMFVNIHETSVGQLYPIETLSAFCKQNGMYFVVDGISSVFADTMDFTNYHVDALVFSTNKALALAPGIAVVCLSERLYKERVEKEEQVKSLYFNFKDHIKNMERGQTPFTPAISVLYEMDEMVARIAKQGMEEKVRYTNMLASDFRKKLSECGFKVPTYPMSNAVTPVIFEKNASEYYDALIKEYKITVNPCGGAMADKMLRIGHLGNLTVEDNTALVNALVKIREKIG